MCDLARDPTFQHRTRRDLGPEGGGRSSINCCIASGNSSRLRRPAPQSVTPRAETGLGRLRHSRPPGPVRRDRRRPRSATSSVNGGGGAGSANWSCAPGRSRCAGWGESCAGSSGCAGGTSESAPDGGQFASGTPAAHASARVYTGRQRGISAHLSRNCSYFRRFFEKTRLRLTSERGEVGRDLGICPSELHHRRRHAPRDGLVSLLQCRRHAPRDEFGSRFTVVVTLPMTASCRCFNVGVTLRVTALPIPSTSHLRHALPYGLRRPPRYTRLHDTVTRCMMTPMDEPYERPTHLTILRARNRPRDRGMQAAPLVTGGNGQFHYLANGRLNADEGPGRVVPRAGRLAPGAPNRP